MKKEMCRIAAGLLHLALLIHAAPVLAETPTKTLTAILPFEAVGATPVETSVAYDRMQDELLLTGRFDLVERSQINAILDEQALQQAACSEGECAVKVGRILGVRNIVSGKVTKLDDTHWVISGRITDVETAQTLRATSIQYEGKYFNLLADGMPILAAKLAGLPPPEKPGFLGQVVDLAVAPIRLIADQGSADRTQPPNSADTPKATINSGFHLSTGFIYTWGTSEPVPAAPFPTRVQGLETLGLVINGNSGRPWP